MTVLELRGAGLVSVGLQRSMAHGHLEAPPAALSDPKRDAGTRPAAVVIADRVERIGGEEGARFDAEGCIALMYEPPGGVADLVRVGRAALPAGGGAVDLVGRPKPIVQITLVVRPGENASTEASPAGGRSSRAGVVRALDHPEPAVREREADAAVGSTPGAGEDEPAARLDEVDVVEQRGARIVDRRSEPDGDIGIRGGWCEERATAHKHDERDRDEREPAADHRRIVGRCMRPRPPAGRDCCEPR